MQKNPTTLYSDWKTILYEEFAKDYFQKLRFALAREYHQYTVYPKKEDIFTALNLTPYKKVKVVIIGQDPYHGPGEAHGLSFSVQPGIAVPPSLRNIFKELKADLNIKLPESGDLTHWAKQGVLLLNSVLTVKRGLPNSHRGLGWELFTDRVIQELNNHPNPLAFILWGKNAQEKANLLNGTKHYIIKTAHPSPFSAHRGFFNSKPFSKVNNFLVANRQNPITWF
ncbi:MAG: uracil-DNA glycosylase Ung [Bacillota bacterium]|jgi:uracil-DNA glycosylase